MAVRLPSTPPALPGFSYLRPLGSGGFADVFLYEQNLPRRQVAIKVLLAAVVSDPVRRLFQAEANLMAQLSAHPSVLTVFQAGVSADGRPYLVMEYCSNALDQRYRSGRLPVSELLRIGVTIASAVETAHRAGVLHRDIKPSNILITAYGHPVLADFGIAATLGEAEETDQVGLSIPWSAPEVLFDESPGSVAAEVWSLGATLYTLLAGRSPFELPGDRNSPAQLMARIQKTALPAIGRPDVPERLELLLARALSKRPERRQASALDLIRELQAVEAELGLAQTPVELATAEWEAQTAGDAADRTRINGVVTVAAQPARRQRREPGADRARTARTSTGRTSTGRTSTAGTSTARPGWVLRRGTLAAVAAGGLLMGGLGVAAGALLVGLALSGAPASIGTAAIPRVSDVAGRTGDGTVVFSWADPGVAVDDSYLVSLSSGESSLQRGTEFIVQTGSSTDTPVCITVSVSRDGRTGAESTEKCVDPAPGMP
ncbi:serine/threonine protein kinase [Cryobacterium lactosi]|uniref:non-specific serine/threonine protein kinase n=1 Tax=Cryobacterium lactosi TaxID=1259202 RepID=A0A4R9BJE0_9MICO|nr:serine/threonine-protein kinase [Cryobacterium lactosi]TFD85824.1 serine/threonine protein kinase [Cryobacterium lactosi]